ncbi:MAG: hypothetical protein MRY21_08470 [Simkaniaceae bacterium]|nr:hypothetical protein [Simkaniaceae bacterium]
MSLALGKSGKDAFTSDYDFVFAFYKKIKGQDKTEADFNRLIESVTYPIPASSSSYGNRVNRVYTTLQMEDLKVKAKKVGRNFEEDHRARLEMGMTHVETLRNLYQFYPMIEELNKLNNVLHLQRFKFEEEAAPLRELGLDEGKVVVVLDQRFKKYLPIAQLGAKLGRNLKKDLDEAEENGISRTDAITELVSLYRMMNFANEAKPHLEDLEAFVEKEMKPYLDLGMNLLEARKKLGDILEDQLQYKFYGGYYEEDVADLSKSMSHEEALSRISQLVDVYRDGHQGIHGKLAPSEGYGLDISTSTNRLFQKNYSGDTINALVKEDLDRLTNSERIALLSVIVSRESGGSYGRVHPENILKVAKSIHKTEYPLLNRKIDRLVDRGITRYITQTKKLRSMNFLLSQFTGVKIENGLAVIQPDCSPEVKNRFRTVFERFGPHVGNHYHMIQGEMPHDMFHLMLANKEVLGISDESIIKVVEGFYSTNGLHLDNRAKLLLSIPPKLLRHLPSKALSEYLENVSKELNRQKTYQYRSFAIDKPGIVQFLLTQPTEYTSLIEGLMNSTSYTGGVVERLIDVFADLTKASGERHPSFDSLLLLIREREAFLPHVRQLVICAADLQLTGVELNEFVSQNLKYDFSKLSREMSAFSSSGYSIRDIEYDFARVPGGYMQVVSPSERIEKLCEAMGIDQKELPEFFKAQKRVLEFATNLPVKALESFSPTLATVLIDSIDLGRKTPEQTEFIANLMETGSAAAKMHYLRKEYEDGSSYLGRKGFTYQTQRAIQALSPIEKAEVYKILNPEASGFIDSLDPAGKAAFLLHVESTMFVSSYVHNLGSVVLAIYESGDIGLFEALNGYMHWHIGFSEFRSKLSSIIREGYLLSTRIVARLGEPFESMILRSQSGAYTYIDPVERQEQLSMEVHDDRLAIRREEMLREAHERLDMQANDDKYVPEVYDSFSDSDFGFDDYDSDE